MWKIVAIALGITLTSGLAASDPQTIELWPGPPPGDTGSIGEEKVTKLSDGKTGGITNVSKPTITVYRPESNTGLAMVVCPGGGYNHAGLGPRGRAGRALAQRERHHRRVAEVPGPEEGRDAEGPAAPQALMDAQRALSLTRSHADDWGIDPEADRHPRLLGGRPSRRLGLDPGRQACL